MSMEQPPNPNAQAPVSGASGVMVNAPPPIEENPPATPVDPAKAKQAAIQKMLNPIKLTADEVQKWLDEIEKSETRTKNQTEAWDILLNEYLPVVTDKAEEIKVNAHFRNVHTKIGQLFVKSPEIRLKPKGPMLDQILEMDPSTGMPMIRTPAEIVPIKQAVVNTRMGPDFIGGLDLMDELLFDQEAWSGISCTKVGYKCVNRIIQQPVTRLMPDPATGAMAPQPVIDPVTQQPQTQPVSVPIYQDWYATRFSPKKILFDNLLKSCRWAQQSRWIGMKFSIPKDDGMKEFGLSEEDFSGTQKDEAVFEHKEDAEGGSGSEEDLMEGYELWVKASFFIGQDRFPNADHPEAIIQITFIKGMNDRTAVCRPSTDQTFDQLGKLTDDSLIGFPIKIGSLRIVADGPFPKADSAFTNAQVKHLNTDRTQSVKTRDANIGKWAYDTDAIDKDDLNLIKNGDVGAFIGLKGGALAGGIDKVFVPLTQLRPSPNDQAVRQVIKADMDETLGISANQAGSQLETVRSATEIAETSASSAGRQGKEQGRAIRHYLEIVRAVDTLLMRYFTGEDYVEVVGDDGARKLQKWNQKTIAGRYGYDIKPDSQLSGDVARDRQQKMGFLNLIIQDPMVNRAPILRDLASDFGYDPATIILDQAGQIQQPQAGGPANKHQLENSGQKPGGPAGDNRQERNPQAPQGQQSTAANPVGQPGAVGRVQ